MASVATQAPTAQGESQALTKAQRQELQDREALKSVRELLAQSEQQLACALPKGIPVSYLIRVVLTVVQRTPDLLKCHRITLLGAVFQAAQLGLVPDGVLGQAYLVPFWNNKKQRDEVQFMPGYRGLITLVRRSGELSTIDAEVVREKDVFSYTRGTEPTLKHVPSEDPRPGAITKVWAAARLKDGGYQIVVLTWADVERIAKKRSAAVKAGRQSPWDTDPEWMAKKTALKQLCKLLPVSTETQRALELDNRAEIGLPQDLALLADENETPTVEDDGNGDAPRPEEELIAAELECDPARAVAVLAGFAALNMAPAQRNVNLKKYHRRADELLQLLRDMSGQPLVVWETFKEIADAAAAKVERQPLDARAHAGDGDEAAREAGAPPRTITEAAAASGAPPPSPAAKPSGRFRI